MDSGEKDTQRLLAVCSLGIKMSDKTGESGETATKCRTAQKVLKEQGILKSGPAFQDCMLGILHLQTRKTRLEAEE